jgi:hypothetical protein
LVNEHNLPKLFSVIRIVEEKVVNKPKITVNKIKLPEITNPDDLRINNPMSSYRSKSMDEIKAHGKAVASGLIEPSVSRSEFLSMYDVIGDNIVKKTSASDKFSNTAARSVSVTN